jgi:hypothetical protein
LAHALQHVPQRYRGDLEYRSYLGKPGQFRQLALKRQENLPHDEKLYYDLYRASPQEIGAFANDMAAKIMDDQNFSDIKYYSDEDILNLKVNEFFDAGGIVYYVKNHLYNFTAPSTPRERMVFKRYIKLIYQYLAQYVLDYKQQVRQRVKQSGTTQ